MRGICLLLLGLLTACTTTQPGDDQPVTAYWDGGGLVYETKGPPSPKSGLVLADVTLVELDEVVAQKLLGIASRSDIAPRAFRSPVGDIAAVNACYGHGRVLMREKVELWRETKTDWSWSRKIVYLRDWEPLDAKGKDYAPVFDSLAEGIDGEFTLRKTPDGYSIALRSTAAQVGDPIPRFSTTLGVGPPVSIQLPAVSITERVATETIKQGETAMFQLGRAPHGDSARIQLLFVRLISTD